MEVGDPCSAARGRPVAHDATARAEQRIALLRTIEAIRHYAAAHERLPANSAEITEVPLPIDPFTGELFQVQMEDGQLVLDTIQRRGKLIKRYRVRLAEDG